jgi:hypothetical protein
VNETQTQERLDAAANEALTLAAELWPLDTGGVIVMLPEQWTRLRNFLLEVPELLGVLP